MTKTDSPDPEGLMLPVPGVDYGLLDQLLGYALRRAQNSEGRWFLDPRARSDGYQTIPVTETTEIWGVVAGVVRRLPVE